MTSKLFNLKSRLVDAKQECYKYEILAPIELQMEKEIRDNLGNINNNNNSNNNQMNENEFNMKAINRTKVKSQQSTNTFERIKIITPESLSQNDVGHGLISYYNQKHATNNSTKIQPKLAICITMYNESRKELEASIDGILKNMKHFKEKLGVENEEIVVVVIYDGIDKINNEVDPEENMIEYFDLWDRTEGAKYNKSSFTIPQKYKKFCEKVERSKFNVEEMKNNEFKIFKENEKLEKEFQAYKSNISQDERKIEAQKADFLYKVKQNAQKYIESKCNNAILYQTRVSIPKVGDQNQQQQGLQTTNKNKENEDYLHIFHCIKYKNGGKLSSHLWFFSGFCELFQPEHTILLDCGLIPDEEALVNMYLALETDPNIGGVCGFMGIKFQNVYNESGERTDGFRQENVDWLSQIYEETFSIQKAQMYEYNMGHLIDKPFESLFGYIQVLPGAFSGYRWEALKRDQQGYSILDDYLASVLDKNQELTLEQQNMNLAEDRILCLKIYSKRGKKYTLRYIRNATARVDPVTDLITLVGQRRRWINGSHFALLEGLKKKSIVYESDHSTFDLIKFKICMKFAQLSNFLGYISLSIFFTIVFIMILTNVKNVTLSKSEDPTSVASVVLTTLFLVSYFMCILVIIYYSISFNNRNPKVESAFYSISTYLGLIMLASFGLMMAYIVEMMIFVVKKYITENITVEDENRGLLSSWRDEGLRAVFSWIVVLGFVMNVIPLLWYPNRIIEILKTFIHYMAYQAQYIHLLLIYAICRIDDLSWGTKNSDESGAQQEMSKQLKFKFVSKWFITNVTIGIVFSILLTSQSVDQDAQFSVVKPYILFLISVLLTGQLFFRIFFASVYEIYFMFFRLQMRAKGKRILNDSHRLKIRQDIVQQRARFFINSQ